MPAPFSDEPSISGNLQRSYGQFTEVRLACLPTVTFTSIMHKKTA